MRVRLTGISFPIGGIQWNTAPGDKDIAIRVLNYLEDRRLLYVDRDVERASYAVVSALHLRAQLTNEINSARPGRTLEQSLRRIRAACRKFVDRGGPRGHNFRPGRENEPHEADPFGLALGDLRTTIGFEIALIASKFELDIPDELATILPLTDDDGDDDADLQTLLELFDYGK
jgi:uncharacterized protein DUF6650